MPTLGTPPEAPVVTPEAALVAASRAQASEARLSDAEVAAVLTRLQARFPRTRFEAAWPAELPGFAALRLENGSVAYADKNARYFILGLVLDTSTGAALDRQLDGTP